MTSKDEQLLTLAEKKGNDADLLLLDKINALLDKVNTLEVEIKRVDDKPKPEFPEIPTIDLTETNLLLGKIVDALNKEEEPKEIKIEIV